MTAEPRIALIPAAGRGTRFHPLSRAVPKELLPVGGLPMIHFAVEEAAEAGFEEIVVIIAPGKEIIRNYFEASADSGGMEKGEEWAVEGVDGEARLAELQKKVHITFIEQPEPNGLGDAILSCRSLIGGSPFAVVLPDNVWWGRYPLVALKEAFVRRPAHLVGLMRLEGKHAGLFGNNGGVELERLGSERYRVVRVQEKGSGTFPLEPDSSAIRYFARHIYMPDALDRLETIESYPSGELDDVPLLQQLAGEGLLEGVFVEGRGLDVGNIQGLLAGNRWVEELGLPL